MTKENGPVIPADTVLTIDVAEPIQMRVMATGAIEIDCFQDLPKDGVAITMTLRFSPGAAGRLARNLVQFIESQEIKIVSADMPGPLQ
jgi:hypothetical protein